LASTACKMYGAVVHDNPPALPVPGAEVTVVQPNKLSRKTAEEDGKKKPPPPDVAIAEEPHHPSGIVVEIVLTKRSNQGCFCEEHLNCGEVIAENVVVHTSIRCRLWWRGRRRR
jgi:hypothetical protein